MNLLIGSVFLLSEIIILLVSYKYIYRKKTTASWSSGEFLRALAGYYFYVIKNKIYSSEDGEVNNFLQENTETRYILFREIAFGLALVLFLPCIVVFLCNRLPYASVIVYLAGLGVLLDHLKESRVKLMSLLNESAKFLYKFRRIARQNTRKEKNGESEKKERENRSVNKTEMLLLLTAVICSVILSASIITDIINRGIPGVLNWKKSVFFSPFFTVILLLFLASGLFLFWRYGTAGATMREKIRYRKYIRLKSNIEFWTDDESIETLRNWSQEVLRMCSLVNVKEVKIIIDKVHTKKVFGEVFDVCMPVIILGEGVLRDSQKWGQKAYFDIVKLLIAHELVHICRKDPRWMQKIRMVSVAAFFGEMSVFVMLCRRYNTLPTVIISLVFLIFVSLVLHIAGDEKYWNQVMEFRADRIGLAISGTFGDTLKMALECLGEDEEDEVHKKEGIILKIYNRKFEQPIHPRAERRIYESSRGSKWGMGEYFRYLWIIGRNVYTGKGWKI